MKPSVLNGGKEQSFPSSHTSNAFTAAELLRREYHGINPWYGARGYAFAIATALLRMYHNKHWLGDVIAGAGTGIFSTDIAYLVYPAIRKMFAPRKGTGTLIFPAWQSGGGALVSLHGF